MLVASISNFAFLIKYLFLVYKVSTNQVCDGINCHISSRCISGKSSNLRLFTNRQILEERVLHSHAQLTSNILPYIRLYIEVCKYTNLHVYTLFGEIFAWEIYAIFESFGQISENLSRETRKWIHSRKFMKQKFWNQRSAKIYPTKILDSFLFLFFHCIPIRYVFLEITDFFTFSLMDLKD